MRIAIATVGRFHVLDLARELSFLGHDVDFWSIVPQKRALRFRLPSSSHRRLPSYLWILAGCQRFGRKKVRQIATHCLLKAVDLCIARRLKPCDVFIGMSGLAIGSAITARTKYLASVFIERGSQHILSQKEILESRGAYSDDVERIPNWAIERELASYELADQIVLPSTNAVDSFLERGFRAQHLFKNPYGVDLDMFRPTPAPSNSSPVVLYVGKWSYQKGCDLLGEAFTKMDRSVKLLHVGPAGDAQFPSQDWFEHYEPCPQWELPFIYGQASVFVLASRQEGFGLVLAQALAAGLPIVCSDRTGGGDLTELLPPGSGVFLVPHDNAEMLAISIKEAIAWANKKFPPGTMRDLLGESRSELSWSAYGKRYEAKLTEVMEMKFVQR